MEFTDLQKSMAENLHIIDNHAAEVALPRRSTKVPVNTDPVPEVS